MKYDIIIIGAGPAGMSAAIYARRGGKTVLMIDKRSFGGQIVSTPEVENYPGFKLISGMELANQMYEHATSLGAEMAYGLVKDIKKEDDIFTVCLGNETHTANAIILATGAKNRPMGIEREEQFTGAGISYCAACDGAFFRNKVVAVLGGGNTALEDAHVLSSIASKVYLIHRRNSFRAEAANVERLKSKENVEFILDTVPVEILGNKVVSGLKVKNILTGNERELELNGIFVAFGQMPENEDFKNIVDLDKSGYIISEEDCITNTKGVFTAGDCRTKKVKQIVTAVSDGATSALEAIDYLNTQL